MARKTKQSLKFKRLLTIIISVGFSLIACIETANAAPNPTKFYRYINKDGVKVISVTIPPEYAQKGYEVITKNGEVLQTVKAAPPPEKLAAELERRSQIRALTTEYESLTRRYSSAEDIYAARDRRLTHLNATVSILRNNITSMHKQIEDLTAKAAESERTGREVSKQIISNIEQIKAEIASNEASLKAREEEQTAINNDYQREVDLFKLGPEAFVSRPSSAKTPSAETKTP